MLVRKTRSVLAQGVGNVYVCCRAPVLVLVGSEFMHTQVDEIHAHYSYTIDGIVIATTELNDWGKSVANDLDTVLNEIRVQMGGLTGYAVLHCDRMGIWDGVRLERGLARFYELGETALEGATARLLHLLE